MSLWGMKDSKTVAATTIAIDTAGAGHWCRHYVHNRTSRW